MERAVEQAAVICFLVVGASHIFQPRAWARFFCLLHGWGAPGNFMNALLTLVPGVLIVSFHNVWTGIPAVLTVIGWLYVLKSTIYFVFPQVGLRSIGRTSEDRPLAFIAAGVVLALIGGLLILHLLLGPAEPNG